MLGAMKKLDELEYAAWRAFLRAHGRVTRRLDAELSEECGLTLTAYEVLLRLRYAPGRGMRMAELAEQVLLSPSGITRVVDQFVRRGLVERRREPSDGRGHIAVLTGKGSEALKNASPVHLRGVREYFLNRLTESQLRCLTEALRAASGSDSLGEGPSRSRT
jgi:DNA-binding MarR family transcriptional regulator